MVGEKRFKNYSLMQQRHWNELYQLVRIAGTILNQETKQYKTKTMEEFKLEKFFIVTEKSGLHKEWFEYQENKKAIQALVKEFMKDSDIESDFYFALTDSFYIVPTDKDSETFKSVLCSPIEDKLCKFRTTSKIGKAWTKILKDANLKVIRKPMVILYFHGIGGRFRSRIFDQNGVLYCSIDPAQGAIAEGFVELKASEFFKIIEDSEKVSA